MTIRLALALLALLAAGCGGSSGELPDSFVVVRSQDNPIVPGNGTLTELVRLELEPGSYQVAGKVELHNRDGAAPFTAQCVLAPSQPDGSDAEPGELGQDWGFLSLERFGEAGDQGGMVLLVSQELEAPGYVALSCEGSNDSDHGAFAAYMSIRATEVGSITSSYATP